MAQFLSALTFTTFIAGQFFGQPVVLLALVLGGCCVVASWYEYHHPETKSKKQ